MRKAIVIGLALAGWAGTAYADVKEECSAAYDQTQMLRRQGKLVAAREKAVACSLVACTYAKKDCTQWLAEIDASMPTVVFAAEDEQGVDLTAVRVSVDGMPLVERLDGKAIALDPGEHTIRFEMDGAAAIEQKPLIREGEKNRRIGASFKKAPPPSSAPAVAPAGAPSGLGGATPAPPPRSEGGAPAWAWVTGALGLVSGGVGVAFWIASELGQSDISANCGKMPPKPGYDPNQCDRLGSANDVKQGLAIGFGGAGAIALGVSIIAIVIAPPRAAVTSTKARGSRTVWVIPTAGGASLGGRF